MQPRQRERSGGSRLAVPAAREAISDDAVSGWIRSPQAVVSTWSLSFDVRTVRHGPREQRALPRYRLRRPHVRLRGIHAHLASGLDSEAMVNQSRETLEWARPWLAKS
ncbi:hypothetical protein GCM10023196_098130 [Actinoallomurus vinaceus]|uniref:Uncharacterized protein n=1 Tax=Actinoallomurus vinaceus TaxID=1080074 RepID=A0ABP8UV46_9ACTN